MFSFNNRDTADKVRDGWHKGEMCLQLIIGGRFLAFYGNFLFKFRFFIIRFKNAIHEFH
jgi:hypothetical protein